MKKFFSRKYLTWALVVIVVAAGGYYFLRPKSVTYKPAYTVSNQDVRKTVISTGTVTSESNLNLSFKGIGILTKLNVKVGDKVTAGQILAMLDERDALASIAQANAQVLSAQANLDKVRNGASNPDVQIAQVALDNAKTAYTNTVSQQQTLVDNAYFALLNSTPQAIASDSNTTATATISGSYTGKQQGSYIIKLYETGNGIYYSASGLGSATNQVNRGVQQPIGNGLYVTFSTTGTLYSNSQWTVQIPNTQASTYSANYNAYQSSLQTQTSAVSTADAAVKSAQAALDQKKAQARPEDIAAAQASLAQAQAQLLIAKNTYNNNIITAPIDGEITSVDIKVGEQVSNAKAAMVLLDQNSLHVESNIPESSIGLVNQGQKIDMTLDAFGPDKHLEGQVLSIDPASTVVSSVIQFRVISSIPIDPSIKPGMTANLNIIINDIPNIIAVPNRLIKVANGKKTVTVLNNNQISEVEITTGLLGDNFTEVTSGLSIGDVLTSTTTN